ncbi:MAG: excinuclease ABC subunit UvrA [Thermoanaerobaculia bacterium]|nr:excinuclease ABC subunit UvrA [Thermoanaerobaculia bacterium]
MTTATAPPVDASSGAAGPRDAVEVSAARTHNLKGVDCRIPHGKVTVVTGVSGAGKSSLAFDTIYAEAQRRFVESMSTYVRQFLEQMERPPVDEIHGVLPAVALEAKNAIKNARSTVGTLTEVHDVLRLLFSHLGTAHCPDPVCSSNHGPVYGRGPQQVADRLCERWPGDQVLLVAALPRPKKQATAKLRELVRQGYFRRYLKLEERAAVEHNRGIARMTPSDAWRSEMDPLLVALGRFGLKSETRARLVSAVEEAYRLAGGKVRAITTGGEEFHFGRGLTCESCGSRVERPTPALFSFNSPLGACSECQGFGRVTGIDRDRVVPDGSKSLEEHPLAVWNTDKRRRYYSKLLSACRAAGVRTDVPWAELTADEREFVWSGPGRFTSLNKFFARLERKRYRVHVRVLLARYRAYETCPLCNGTRLQTQARAVTIRGRNIAELSAMSVEDLRHWLASEDWSGDRVRAAEHLLEHLRLRLDVLRRVGLDYLTLDRQGRTLSGGESQRIHLASALGAGLTGTMYVLDEPTIGLHPRDSDQLLSLLRALAERGNTVLVVEHDRCLIEGADHVIDLGPRAGEHGGELLAEGTLDQIRASKRSLTAEYLGRDVRIDREDLVEKAAEIRNLPQVRIVGARQNNLRDLDVSFPLGCLVAVTGVSGSGKSTLVENVLYGTYQRTKGVVDVEPGAVDELRGLDQVEDLVLVDQRPLGRSSRSNPVTYVKAYDEIRKLFAATPDAVRRGITPGHFSFNVDKGRCTVCHGTGEQELDMHFMDSVTVTCEECRGRRFRPEVLAVQLRGRNIYETLNLTVDEAAAVFSDRAKLVRILASLQAVGLGYLRLGQSTSTLSGGEAQRLKLASFLTTPRRKGSSKPRLFLFDEPTTGLHLADIDLLHRTLRRLVERGDGVIVVEHATDFVAHADWIVDLGPGGGVHGGELNWSGPLLDFVDGAPGATADSLRHHLEWQPSKLENPRKELAADPAGC